MAKNLASLVSKENVVKAFEKILAENLSLIPSSRFDVIYKNKSFPPKEVIRIAAQIQGIQNLDTYRLNGGEPTNRYLRAMDFEITAKETNANLKMTQIELVNRLKLFLDDTRQSEQFGKYNYAGINDELSFGTPGGAWEAIDYPGYTFTNGKKSYLLRLINLEKSTYIVFEAIHINSQLLNFNLSPNQTFRNFNGLITITENYLMTIGGRVAAAKVKQAMVIAGFNEDSIITTIEEDDFLPKQIIQDLIEWAEIRERAKELIKNNMLPILTPTPIETIKNKTMFSLNTIMYGPPGTGKTYHTITKAAEIITGENFLNRYAEAKALYKQKQEEEQIEFVTFHQNYSYEDFVAGLRPNAENGQLSFKEHKGVFYRISKKAEENWKDFQQYQMGDKFKVPGFEEILNEFLKPLAERDEPIILQTLARNVNFKLYSINEKNFGLEKSSGSKEHTISMSTLKALYEGRREYNLQGLGVYYYPIVDRLKQIAITLKKEISEVKLLNFVLIIDEINRANISRVFGELITLLEADKRLGEKHELTLRLPGLPDDERFGVPPNLYIIATMNTADKSIALIDIALRRRFVFEDMYPRPDVINTTVPEAYRAFLIALNNLITEKKGVDFTIGHGYFIPDEERSFDIVQIFNQKVIPLLNEYFYNQRNNPVWSLLSPLQPLIPSIIFEQDEFIGIKAKVAV